MGHLIGQRIVLREYRQEDLPEMRKWANNPAITNYLSQRFIPAQTVPMTDDYLQRVLSGNHNNYNFVIADRETEAYIGQIDLFNLNSINRCAEMGIVIGSADKQGQGIGEEAIGLLLRFAFLQANLQRVELWVMPENKGGIRCYEKAGFVHEGRRRQAEFFNGSYSDLLLMGALRDEWLAAHPAG